MSQPCDLIQLAQDMQVGLHAWWSVLGSCEPDSGTEALSHFTAKLRMKTKNKRQARQSSREDDFGQESTSIEGEATIRCHDAHAMQGGNNAIADGAQLSRNRQIVYSLMHSHVVQRLPSVPLRQSVRHDQLVLPTPLRTERPVPPNVLRRVLAEPTSQSAGVTLQSRQVSFCI